MKKRSSRVLVALMATAALAFSGAAIAGASNGADDPAGHISGGHGADDAVPHQSGVDDHGGLRHRGKHGRRHHRHDDDGPGHHRHDGDDGPNHT
jgi:hypothetical protein